MDIPPPSPASEDFVTDTRFVKRRFLMIAVGLWVVFGASSFYGGYSWIEAVETATGCSGALLAGIWTYGAFQIFDRRYRIAPEGISLYHRERLIHHIPWHHIHSVSHGHLRVRSQDGPCIQFNLPPAIQRQAREAIKAFRS